MIIQWKHIEKSFGTCNGLAEVGSQPKRDRTYFPLNCIRQSQNCPVAPGPTTPSCSLQSAHTLSVFAGPQQHVTAAPATQF